MDKKTCQRCSGTGKVTCEGCNDSASALRASASDKEVSSWAACASCRGTGKITCPTCSGKGEIRAES